MRFGVCAPLSCLETISAAGYAYLEPGVIAQLQPEKSEDEIMPALLEQFAASHLKPEVFNLLLPGDLKVLGPSRDRERQERYLHSTLKRAKQLGGEVVVFGSGGARRVPSGMAASEARSQMLEFLNLCGTAAQLHGLTIAIEPLNQAECNSINSVAEAVSLVQELGHPSVGVLSDLYHVTHDKQNYAETREALLRLRHVHVAGLGRRSPSHDDFEYLRDYLRVLKESGYEGRISIEARWDNLEAQAGEARQVLERAWELA